MSCIAQWWEGRDCSGIQLAFYGTAKLLLAACLPVFAASVCHCIIPSSFPALQLSVLLSPLSISLLHTPAHPFTPKHQLMSHSLSLSFSLRFLSFLCQPTFPNLYPSSLFLPLFHCPQSTPNIIFLFTASHRGFPALCECLMTVVFFTSLPTSLNPLHPFYSSLSYPPSSHFPTCLLLLPSSFCFIY